MAAGENNARSKGGDLAERAQLLASGLGADRAEVLRRTVDQLNKDLGGNTDPIAVPPVDDHAFEALRAQVLPVLDRLFSTDPHAANVAMYRVDLSQAQRDQAIGDGGLNALAGAVVLRCLQKVLTRMRFSGEF